MTFENRTVLNKDAHIAMNRNLLKHRMLSNILHLILPLSITVIYAVLLVDKAGSSTYLAMISILWLLSAYYFATYLIFPRFKCEKLANYNAQVTYTFSEEVLRVVSRSRSGTDDGSVDYSEIQRVRSGRDAYYLYIERNIIFIVSKGGFARGTDLSEFEELLKRVIDPSKIKF